MKKCYIAIIGDKDGKTVGTIMVRGFRFMSAKWFYNELEKVMGDNMGTIIDFKRIK